MNTQKLESDMKVKRISNEDVRWSIKSQGDCWVIGEVYDVLEEDNDDSCGMRYRVAAPNGKDYWDYDKNWEVVA
jgi:hypothetical protein